MLADDTICTLLLVGATMQYFLFFYATNAGWRVVLFFFQRPTWSLALTTNVGRRVVARWTKNNPVFF
jgi:hypothetical protein